MNDHNTARVGAEASRAGVAVGWRLVVKMGERNGENRRWELLARPPGVAGERGVRMVSSFETQAGWKRDEFARALLGCIERLLDRVAADGGVGR